MDKKFRRGVSRRSVGTGRLISAGALIYCRTTHRYLFLLRNGDRHDGSWGLVGGKLEAGETPIKALTREISEEIGEITYSKVIPLEHFTSDNHQFEYHTYLIEIGRAHV